MMKQLAELGRFALPLHVIDGNHEDHAWLLRTARAELGDCQTTWIDEFDLHYHPRGTVSELCGLRVAWCGGAAHVRRPQEFAQRGAGKRRRSGPPTDPLWSSWISDCDVALTLKAIGTGPFDLMVTHSCPAGIGVGMRGNDDLVMQVIQHIWKFGLESGPENDAGETQLTRLWQRLPNQPRHWIFGHWHTERTSQVENTTFHCVGGIDRGLLQVCPRVRWYEVATHQIHEATLPLDDVRVMSVDILSALMDRDACSSIA